MSLPTTCPLCGANGQRQNVVTRHVYGGDGDHAVFHCHDCDVRYLHPAMSPEDEKRLYRAEFESFMAERSAEGSGWEQPQRHVEANDPQIERRLRYLKPYLEEPKRVLEVGCSSGFMLYPLAEQGHDCVAIEPSGVFADFVRGRSIPCYDSLEDLAAQVGAKAQFDLIMHFYVMEHVRDPASFLNVQLQLLAPGGRIVFEVPHANDALTAIYDIPSYERFIWVVSHHWYFSEASLRVLCERLHVAHEILQDQRYDLSNHMVWARDGKPGGLGRYTPIIGSEIEDAYRQALIAAGHGDTLVAILSKA